MKLRFRQFVTLTGLTALEAIRQPVCLILTVTCVVLTTLLPLALSFNFGEEGKLARDGGLAFHLVIGLFITVFVAASSLSKEIKSGTASAVLSKPVDREIFFLAKFAGIIIVLAAFSLCASASTLIGERIAEKYSVTSTTHTGYITDILSGFILISAPILALFTAAFINYRFRKPFESTAFILVMVYVLIGFLACGLFTRNGDFAPYNLMVEWRILPVSLLITITLFVIAAFALTFSTRLSILPTMILCIAVLIMGMMSDYLLGSHANSSFVAAAIYWIIPNWQHFWVSDALIGNGSVPWDYIASASLYALLYGTGIILIGTVSFRHIEMK